MDMDQMVRFCRESSLLSFGVNNGILGPNSEENSEGETSTINEFTVQVLVNTLHEMRAYHRSVARKVQYENRLLRMKEIESNLLIEKEFHHIKEKNIERSIEMKGENEVTSSLPFKYVIPSKCLNAKISDLIDNTFGLSSFTSSPSSCESKNLLKKG